MDIWILYKNAAVRQRDYPKIRIMILVAVYHSSTHPRKQSWIYVSTPSQLRVLLPCSIIRYKLRIACEAWWRVTTSFTTSRERARTNGNHLKTIHTNCGMPTIRNRTHHDQTVCICFIVLWCFVGVEPYFNLKPSPHWKFDFYAIFSS